MGIPHSKFIIFAIRGVTKFGILTENFPQRIQLVIILI